jgi:hypothetical protein
VFCLRHDGEEAGDGGEESVLVSDVPGEVNLIGREADFSAAALRPK